MALSLVVCRSAGRLPWYLLTNEALTNEEETWRVVFAYVRSFQIEQTWRYDKSELAFQSPRLWHWAQREKLLLMARLSYAFLLTRLAPRYALLRLWLLRSALSRLRQQHPPNFVLLARQPGAQTSIGLVQTFWASGSRSTIMASDPSHTGP